MGFSFLPPVDIPALAGRDIWTNAVYMGTATTARDSAPRPVFRCGSEFYILHLRNESGKTALSFRPLPEGADVTILVSPDCPPLEPALRVVIPIDEVPEPVGAMERNDWPDGKPPFDSDLI